jgi:hypothetical protein
MVPELKRHVERFSSATPSAAAEREWEAVRDAASQLTEGLAKYDKYQILKEQEYRDSAIDSIAKRKAALTEDWVKEAPAAFVHFNHESGSFFKSYPVDMPTVFVTQIFAADSSFIATAQADKLAVLLKAYRTAVFNEDRQRLESLYVEKAATRKGLDPYDYFGRVRIAQDAVKAGVIGDVTSVIGATVVAVTPNAATGKIAVLTSERKKISEIIPSEVEKEARSRKFVVVLHAVSTEVERRVVSKRSETSSRQVGTRRLPNPDYAAAQADFSEAQRQYANQRIQNATTATYGAWGALAKGISEGRGKRPSEHIPEQARLYFSDGRRAGFGGLSIQCEPS